MAIPFLNHLDLQDVSQLQNAILHKTTSATSTSAAGKIIYDTGSNTVKYYNGTAWVEITGDTDNYVDSATLTNNTLTLGRTGTLTDLTVDLSGYDYGSGTYEYIPIWGSGGTSLITSSIYQNRTSTSNDYLFIGINTTDPNSPYGAGDIDVRIATRDTSANPAILDLLRKDGAVTAGEVAGVLQFSVDDDSAYCIARIHAEAVGTAGSGNSGGGRLVFNVSQNTTGVGPAEKMHLDWDGLNLADYGSGSVSGTAAYLLAVTSAGDVVESAVVSNTDVDVSVSNLETRLGQIDSNISIGDSTAAPTVTIPGDLVVQGTTTTVESTVTTFTDPIIELNKVAAGGIQADPSSASGIEVVRASDNVQLVWNETDDDWEFEAFDHAATPALTTYKIPRTYSTTVGDTNAAAGSYSEAVTHNLGTRNVIVQLYDTSSYETVYADVVRTDTNTVTLTFASAPTDGDITVLISTAGA